MIEEEMEDLFVDRAEGNKPRPGPPEDPEPPRPESYPEDDSEESESSQPEEETEEATEEKRETEEQREARYFVSSYHLGRLQEDERERGESEDVGDD